MKGIYVLAMLAVVSLSLVPIVAEESDASYTISYSVHGQEVAWGYEGNLNVPDVEPYDDERFIGWYYLGEIIDPYTYPFEDGIYWLVAGFEDIKQPEPEPDTNWDGIVLSVCVLAMILAIVALVVSRL